MLDWHSCQICYSFEIKLLLSFVQLDCMRELVSFLFAFSVCKCCIFCCLIYLSVPYMVLLSFSFIRTQLNVQQYFTFHVEDEDRSSDSTTLENANSSVRKTNVADFNTCPTKRICERQAIVQKSYYSLVSNVKSRCHSFY